MLVRPVTLNDHAEILTLAKKAGTGMTSLPQDENVLRDKIANAVGSFDGKPLHAHEENYFFVLEDTAARKLAGTTAVVARVGLVRPFYSYKLSTITQASHETGIVSQQQVLHMVNDYTGASEIGSLFLLPEYRRDGIGRFLSRCRYLMLAEFPQLFSDIVISEIRGVQDKNGESPFYNNLAKHFFQMDFKQADYISATRGNQFISDLMPKYPIYTNLLPKEARDVIGVPLDASRPALELLEYEGFRYQGYLDVFDAGPTVQVERKQIRTVRRSRKSAVAEIVDEVQSEEHMICHTRLQDFSICLGSIQRKDDDTVIISRTTAEQLKIKKNDPVRYVRA